MDAHITHTKDVWGIICIGMIHAEPSKIWPNIAKTDAQTIPARIIIITTATAHIMHIGFVQEIIFTGMIPAELSKIYITAVAGDYSANMDSA